MPMKEKVIFGISINVLLMGFVSLFTDVSSEMITVDLAPNSCRFLALMFSIRRPVTGSEVPLSRI